MLLLHSWLTSATFFTPPPPGAQPDAVQRPGAYLREHPHAGQECRYGWDPGAAVQLLHAGGAGVGDQPGVGMWIPKGARPSLWVGAREGKDTPLVGAREGKDTPLVGVTHCADSPFLASPPAGPPQPAPRPLLLPGGRCLPRAPAQVPLPGQLHHHRLVWGRGHGDTLILQSSLSGV